MPALLIGRLAVDRSVRGLGLGTSLVAHVLANAVALNQRAACRAVVVTAIDTAARSWWERLGFHCFDPADLDSFDLYLMTSEIAATPRVPGPTISAGPVSVSLRTLQRCPEATCLP